jgi:hypothetical protein
LEKIENSLNAGIISIPEIMAFINKDRVVRQSELSDPRTSEFFLEVDYSKSLEQMLAAGGYDRVGNAELLKKFVLPAEVLGMIMTVSAKIFHFEKRIPSTEAILAIRQAGFRSANLAELLVLGMVFPDLQTQFPIAAFGSVQLPVIGQTYVPFLGIGGNKKQRIIDLRLFNRDWYEYCRFLAIRTTII